MNIATTRNLSDSALAYLAARPGEQFQAQDLAKFYGCHTTSMRARLGELVGKKQVRAEKIKGTVFYSFLRSTAETKEEKVFPRPAPITHKTYALPAVLAERGRELAEHRVACPSRHI